MTPASTAASSRRSLGHLLQRVSQLTSQQQISSMDMTSTKTSEMVRLGHDADMVAGRGKAGLVTAVMAEAVAVAVAVAEAAAERLEWQSWGGAPSTSTRTGSMPQSTAERLATMLRPTSFLPGAVLMCPSITMVAMHARMCASSDLH